MLSVKYPLSFFLLCLAGFVTVFGFGLANPFLPIYAQELGASETMIGVIMSSYFITRLFLELPSGLISDRIGRRIPMLLGMLLTGTGAALSSIATFPLVLLVSRAIWGSGTCLFFSSSVALLFDLFQPADRGKATGAFQSLEFIGRVIGAPLGGIVAETMGRRMPFTMTAIIVFIGFLLVATSKDFKKYTRRREKRTGFVFDFSLLRNGGLLVLSIGNFTRAFAIQGTISTIFPLYAVGLGVDLAGIGIIMGVRTVGMIVGNFLTSRFMDRIGLKPLLLAALLLDGTMTTLYTFGSSFEQFSMIAVMDGLAAGIEMISLTMYLSMVIPSASRGTGIGIYRTFMDAGAATGPIMLTAILAMVGQANIRVCFYVGAAAVGLMALLALTLKSYKAHAS